MSLNNPVADAVRPLDRRDFLCAAAAGGAMAALGLSTARVARAADGKETSSSADGKQAAGSSAADSASADSPTPATIDWREVDLKELVSDGAKISRATTYGTDDIHGEGMLYSVIRCTLYYDTEADKVVYIELDEPLLPVAEDGWADLDDATASKLGDAVLMTCDVTIAKSFSLGGLTWTGSLDEDAVTYTADIDGTQTDLIGYIKTPEGAAWYCDNYVDGADLLGADGTVATTLEIPTKGTGRHGVDFWLSPITFPGNIQLIKNYLYDHGTSYDYAPGDDIKQNDDGVWEVLDTVTGATLGSGENYFNLAKEAVDEIEADRGETVDEAAAADVDTSVDDTVTKGK